MLNKSVVVLLLGVVLCQNINAQSCTGELGPAQNFVVNVDYHLFLSWMPPMGFGNCAIIYSLHITNGNTTEYLTPVVHTSDLNYIFDYNKYDLMCVYARTYLYAYYKAQSSVVTEDMTFLEPVIEQGPPGYLYLNNTETSLGVHWSPPIGFENCAYYFHYSLTIGRKGSGTVTFSFPVTGFAYSYYFPYQEGHPIHCQEVDVELSASLRGTTTSRVESAILGPPGGC